MSTPALPRPSSLATPIATSTGRVVNEDRRDRARSGFFVRWDAIITVIVASAIAFVLGMGVQWQVTTAVNEDLHGGLPRCTDEIADAGGMCWGAIR